MNSDWLYITISHFIILSDYNYYQHILFMIIYHISILCRSIVFKCLFTPTDTVDQTDRPELINNQTNESPQYKNYFYINNKHVHSYIYTQTQSRVLLTLSLPSHATEPR